MKKPERVYIRFENDTHNTVRGLYISPYGSSQWGPDRLEVENFGKGEFATIGLDNISRERHDVKIVYEDGSAFDQISFYPTRVDRMWITVNNEGDVIYRWHNV
jgi:hypothetical protein